MKIFSIQKLKFLLKEKNLFFLEIRCKDPDKMGMIATQISTHSVGGVAHYNCPRGYYMEGNETRICLQNGSWSGTSPACYRNYQFFIEFIEIIIEYNNYYIN